MKGAAWSLGLAGVNQLLPVCPSVIRSWQVGGEAMVWHCFHQHGSTFSGSTNLSEPAAMTVSPKGRERMFDAISRRQDYEPSNLILRAKLQPALGAALSFLCPSGQVCLLDFLYAICCVSAMGKVGMEWGIRQAESCLPVSESLELEPRASHSTQYMRSKTERRNKFQ